MERKSGAAGLANTNHAINYPISAAAESGADLMREIIPERRLLADKR